MYKHIEDARKEGKAAIRGWVHRHRDSKEVVFFIVRDVTGEMQVTVKKGSKDFEKAKKLSIESSVTVHGSVVKDKRAPGGYEMHAEKIEVIGHAERFPITKDQSAEFLLDVRHLWLRSTKMRDIMKIRSTVLGAIHEWYRKHDFYEFQSPIFTKNACEGGATLFTVDYYKEPVFLAQSWQLYAEAGIHALEKIYTVAPSFRSEKSRTVRHLTEYWHHEMEAAWCDMDGAIKIAEEVISFVVQTVLKKHKKELEALGADVEALKKVKAPFPRLKYKEALKILEKDGMKVRYGKDLRTLEEKTLVKHFDRPVVVTHYPKEIKAFYMPEAKDDPSVVLGFDIIAPHVGELVGGSERATDIEYLKKRLKEEKADLKAYEFYFDLRKYGDVPHSGFGLGVERLVQWVCGLETIKDAIPFPRTMDRVMP